MISIALLALAVLPVLVLGMGVIGSALRYGLGRLLPGSFHPPQDWTAAFVRIVEDVAIGFAVIPIVFLFLTVLGTRLGEAAAYGLLVIGGVTLLARVAWDRASFGVPFRSFRAPGRWALAAIGVVFALVLAFRLVPYGPFLVYSGDDIRMFTLITQLLQTNGGPPLTSWGSFAGPTWNVVVDNHLTFSGSEAIFASVSWWVGGNLPQTVSATVIAISTMIPFGAYVFFTRLFPSRDPSLPVFGALSVGLFSAYPLFFLQWGGIDETVGWFLFPVSLSFLLGYLAGGRRSLGGLLLGGILFGGAVISNPLSAFYVGTFLVALLVAILLFRTQIVHGLTALAAYLGLAIALVSPLIYKVVAGWNSTITTLPPGSEGWGTWQTDVILRPGDWSGSIGRFFELNTAFSPILFVTVVGLSGLILFYRRDRFVTALGIWLVVLLLLNTNGPFGLYYVQYPLWNVPYPDRIADIMFLPLSGGVALVLSELWRRRSHGTNWAADHREVSPSPVRRAALRRTAVTGSLVVFVVVMTVGATAAAEIGFNNNATVAWGNPFTPQDAAGFQWIETNIPRNATILVTSADSGTWIPEFTSVRVFPYPELINNPTVVNVVATIPSLFNTTSYAPALGFIRDYNTSYVYFGERTEYSIVRGLDVPEFVDPTQIVPFVSSSNVCQPPSNNDSVILVCNNDTVTFRGPVVLHLAESHNGAELGTAWVGIPTGIDWTFVLRSSTAQWPGNWSAVFSEQPIGSTLFEDQNVFIIGLNPLFLKLSQKPTAVLNQTLEGDVPQL
jgi:hypothetical protein